MTVVVPTQASANAHSVYEAEAIPNSVEYGWDVNDQGFVATGRAEVHRPMIWHEHRGNRIFDHHGGRLYDLNHHGDALASITGLGVIDAYVWTASGELLPIGNFGSRRYFHAGGINKWRMAVGALNDPTATMSWGFLWNDGKLINLYNLIGATSASDINDRGWVIVNIEGQGHNVWKMATGELVKLKVPTGSSAAPKSMNNLGQVVGYMSTGSDFDAVVWDENGDYTLLPPLPGGYYEQATDMNDFGVVVGVSHTAEGFQRAVIWQGGVPVELGTLPGYNVSIARAINNHGVIVGESRDGPAPSQPMRWLRASSSASNN
jgi:probable HAF family extracellular repeat protein